MTIDDALNRLKSSPFRQRFHLTGKDVDYIRKKGREAIRRHAADMVKARLAPAVIPNDGKQTPMRGHPVFIAQHATACCCRGCLHKWYKVPTDCDLTEVQQEKIVNLLMAWMEREYARMAEKDTH